MNNDSVAIMWKEPPAPNANVSTRRWDLIASQLKANPGKWALIGKEKGSGYAASLKKRGEFEIRYVTKGLGYKRNFGDLYARFPAGGSDE